METLLRQEALRQRLKLLTEQKSDLQTQLMDCRLRIEQEGKVRISAEGLCVKSHDMCWFSFVISQTSCFKFR